MKQQLHRSVTFWSGLLVMIFIGWAWQDSERFWTNASYQRVTAHNGWGGLLVFYNTPRASTGPEFARHPQSIGFLHRSKVLPAAQFLRVEDVTEAQQEELLKRLFVRGDDGKVTFHPELCTMREFMSMFSIPMRPGSSALFLPYWLLLLAIALPWTGLLLWRARRRRSAAL